MLLHRRWAYAVREFTRWQHFSAWNNLNKQRIFDTKNTILYKIFYQTSNKKLQGHQHDS